MANFLFYKYHFEYTGEKGLFSTEEGENVDGSYLNTQFAEDVKAKTPDRLLTSMTSRKIMRHRKSSRIESYNSRVVLQCCSFITIST